MTLTPQEIVDSIMQGKHDTILQGFDLRKFVTQVFEIGYIECLRLGAKPMTTKQIIILCIIANILMGLITTLYFIWGY